MPSSLSDLSDRREPGGKTSQDLSRRAALAALTGTLLLGACGDKQVQQAEIRPVKSQVVRLQLMASESSYSGEVRARYETRLAFRVGGKVTGRYVEVGQEVKAGQALARLDPQDLQLSVMAKRAQRDAAKADFDKAKADLDRYAHLLERKFISPAEFDQRRLAYEAARSRFEQAEAQLSFDANQAAYSSLVADHAGVVTSVDAEVGQVVAPGQSVVRVARLDEKDVLVNVPESRVEELRAVEHPKVVLWANPGKIYSGRLREIAPDADRLTRTYAAKVSIVDADDSVRLGMTANVLLGEVGRASGARLPLTALIQRGKQPQVWVVDPKTGKVHARPVKVGDYIDNDVMILAGLQDGARVVTAGASLLFEGQQVKVMDGAGR